MEKTINLNEKRIDLEILGNLEMIGLDREMLDEYNNGSMKERDKDKILQFFKRREKISSEFEGWISQSFRGQKDIMVLLSVMTEHLQNLLLPDLDEMNEMFFGIDGEEEALTFMKDIDKMIVIANTFEDFHMKNIIGYVRKM